jgi:SAM-dependent methyltransferase
VLKRVLSVVAPRQSRRRLALSFLRDAVRSPRSMLQRLSAENFANRRVCAALKSIHCNVCGADSGLFYDFPDVRLRHEHGIGLLRETLACRACGASMRDRQMAHGLIRVFEARTSRESGALRDLRALRTASRGELEILDTDSFGAINRVLRGMAGYRHSQYRPDLQNGAGLPDGSLNVDLLAMPFPTASLDIVMSSDVMEHVEEDERAHREIYRCLRAGGTYVFTVPYDPCLMATRRLTQRTGTGTPSFILRRHAHGDPLSRSGILAHRIYGQQFQTELRNMGFSVDFRQIDDASAGIFGGDLFLASKPSTAPADRSAA